MDLHELLTDPNPHRKPTSLCLQRQVPAQPSDVTPGKIYLGSDIGEIDYAGPAPQVGDLVLVVGPTARKIAQTGHRSIPMHAPLFSEECLCRCPNRAGTVFYLAFVRSTPVIHAINATTGALLQLIGREELGYHIFGSADAALAADPKSPHNLYVLDDRRPLLTIRTDIAPTLHRGYFGIVTFVLTGGQYQFSRFDAMTDPYGGSTFPTPSESDPPAIPGNCLGVSSGLPVVTMKNSPARYQSLSGGVFTTHTLLQNGAPLSMGLRGNIVTVNDQPANKNTRYVLATTDDVNFSLVQFTPATDTVNRVINLNLPARASQLAVVCNRLLILAAATNTLGTN